MASTSISVKTILFVENDLVSQTMYQKRLEREGFHVECAQDGRVALDVLSDRAPDLVLLDLMLPKVNGTDVLKFMHADPRLTNIPVIIFSNAPLTEVPPDSPLAQGTKRLLKSDCTFPMLLEAIQETLAHPPEFVIVEAGKMPPTSPGAANNGGSQRNGAGRIAPPETEAAATKKRAKFLKDAVAMIPKIREHSMGYIKAPDSQSSKNHLSGLQHRVHLLNSGAAQADCTRVALLTNAFDVLLTGIMDKPSTVTPSVLQTIAQAVDCLDGLLKNNDGYSTGPALQAKVLVVDDDTVCNRVNVTSLKRASFEAVGVKEPAAALSLLETTPFDLVVLDINMPGMTGFDVCEKLRRLPHCEKTPVIFVTAFNNFDNRKQSVLSGGNDFVSKPVSPSELALKVTINLLKARVQGVPASQPKTSSAASNNLAGAFASASSGRINQPVKNGTQPPGPPNRLAPIFEVGSKDAKAADSPLKMTQLKSDPVSTKAPEPSPQSKTPTSPSQRGNGAAPGADIHERLRQSTAALEHAKADLEQESAERTRVESQWREQLNEARALIGQTETVLKEKEARCNQLETELAGLRRERDELQNKLSTEQQATAKSQQEIKEIKANLEKQSTERARLETDWREQLNAAKTATAQKETTLKAKETRCGQLEKELAGLQQIRDELQNKFAAEQQAVARSQQAVKQLQERLNQVSVELERSQASVKQQTAEQSRLEKEWREQLDAAKAVAGQRETFLKEKEARCGQLEKELVGLQQVRDELQNKFAAEQQTVAKSQQALKESQERLQQSNAELGRVKAELEKQSAERTRLESEWHAQLNTVKAAASRAEAMFAEKETRCGQLEKELARLQQVRDELQNKFAAEQQAVAKSQQAAKELLERLNQVSGELERAKTSWEQESTKRTYLESEHQKLTESKEALNLELRNLRENQAVREAELRDRQKKLAEGLRENVQLLQLRLQEAETFHRDSENGSHRKSPSR